MWSRTTSHKESTTKLEGSLLKLGNKIVRTMVVIFQHNESIGQNL